MGGKSSANGTYTLSVIPWYHVYKMHTRRAATAVAEDSDNDPTVVGDSEHQ